MKYSAGIYRLIVILGIFLLPQTAFADSTVSVSNNGDGSNSSVSVDSQTSGQSTVCTNGNCTTTGGGSKTTVCNNGQCTTTDGNVDYQSADGHTQVQIDNNNSVSNTPSPSEAPTSTPTLTPQPSISAAPVTPTITPDPTIMQMKNDINNAVKEQVDELKSHMKAQQDSISSFIHSEMQSLQELFSHLF